MAAFLFYLVFGLNAVIALIYPWSGVVVTYLVTLLTPQNIWWWAFANVRPALWAVAPTMIGFLLQVVRGQADYTGLKTRINAYMLVLWLSFTVSYYFGPYVDVVNEYRFYDSAFMFSTLQKTFLAYFVATVLIDNAKKLKIFSLVLIVTVIYMTYWANAQYLVHQQYGRLRGPTALDGTGIYSDENNFAVLFVVGAPFLFYLGRYLNSTTIRWLIWAMIPLSWHAIFLTASRGALLGIMAVIALFAIRLERKTVGLAIVALFGVAFAWQAGDVMKSRSSTITGYQEEASASTRLEAWEAAARMMAAHPITGVGFASFGQAYQDFSDKVPRVAHNTFFQIGAEWGVVAGLAYLALLVSTMERLRRNGNRLRILAADADTDLYYCVNEACLLALAGFFVCALFLSLQGYEVLYYLLIVSNATLVLSARPSPDRNDPARVIREPWRPQRVPTRAAPAAARGSRLR